MNTYPEPSPHSRMPCLFARGAARAAFSLVEVVIALGIIAFSLVSVLGLLPIGLSSFRDSIDTTFESQIVNQIASDAALMPFDSLSAFASASPYYFNNEGRKITSGTDAIYRVELTLRDPAYPGVPPGIRASLVNLQAKVYTHRNTATPSLVKPHNLLIARSDKTN